MFKKYVQPPPTKWAPSPVRSRAKKLHFLGVSFPLATHLQIYVRKPLTKRGPIPIGSMYGIFTYICLFLMAKYGECRYIYPTWILWGPI